MPSPRWRIAVIAAYLLLTAVVALAGESLISSMGIITEQCGEADICSPAEWIAVFALAGAFLAARVASIVLGAGRAGFSARAAASPRAAFCDHKHALACFVACRTTIFQDMILRSGGT